MGVWISGFNALVLATNLGTLASTSPLPFRESNQRISWLLQDGVLLHSKSALVLEPLGSAILILSQSKEGLETIILEHDEL